MDLAEISVLTLVYVFFIFFGVPVNMALARPDKHYESPFLSAKFLKEAQNKRLNKEGRFFLYSIFAVFWGPILLINIIHLILIFIKMMLKGFMNICWVFGSEAIANKENIAPEDFDQWKNKLEEFIDSIPVNGEKNGN